MALTAADRETIYAHLSATGQAICDELGLGTTVRLLRQLSGQRVFFGSGPRSRTPDLLAGVVGPAAAKRLLWRLESQHLELPRETKVTKLLRDNALRREFDRLCHERHPRPVEALAQRFGIVQRHCREILAADVATAPAVPLEHVGNELAWLEAELVADEQHAAEQREPETATA
jgi:hypothetical protein